MHSSSSGCRGVKAALRHKLSGLSRKGMVERDAHLTV